MIKLIMKNRPEITPIDQEHDGIDGGLRIGPNYSLLFLQNKVKEYHHNEPIKYQVFTFPIGSCLSRFLLLCGYNPPSTNSTAENIRRNRQII